MTPRTRRSLIITLIVVALLFLGRGLSELLTARWWAAAISPEAAMAVRRWQHLGLLLDALAILLASAWFILLALTIGRTVSYVHITRRLGNLDLREAVPTRYLLAGALLIGVLLGWLTGAGASRWRAPVAQAFLEGQAFLDVQGPFHEPLLGAALGVLLVRLPVWELAHEYLQTLLLVGLTFTATLYLVIGALRRAPRGMDLHPYAQKHLGSLLGLLAVSFGIGFLLDPWRYAVSIGPEQADDGLRAIVALSKPAALLAFLTALATLRWGAGKSSEFALIGWGTLALALVGSAVAAPGSSTPQTVVTNRFNDIAWGIRRADSPRDTTPPLQALWDEASLTAHESATGRFVLAITPADGPEGTPAHWVVASTDSGLATVRARAILASATTSERAPAAWADAAQEAPAVVRPGAPRWREGPSGVPVRNSLRRLILTWGRQALGIASLPDSSRVDWHLDPAARSAALLPMARWLPADVLMVDGQMRWVSQGLIPVERFPRSVRQPVQGTMLAGMLPAFLSVIDPVSGHVSVYLDPAASPLATTWRLLFPELIAPADSLPADLRTALPYSASWAALQVAATGGPGAGGQAPTATWTGAGEVRWAWHGAGEGSVQVGRRNGLPWWAESATSPDVPATRRAFAQLPLFLTLRDSVAARGDSVLMGPIRWSADGSQTWQAAQALLPGQGIRLLAIGQSVDGVVSASRLAGNTLPTPGDSTRPDDLDGHEGQLREARTWLARADSALRRGDLTAFGRYFEALQRTLERDER